MVFNDMSLDFHCRKSWSAKAKKEKMMKEKYLGKRLCPECGGVFFSGSELVYEHRDSQCSFRWVNQKWLPKDSPEAIAKQEVLNDLWWNRD